MTVWASMLVRERQREREENKEREVGMVAQSGGDSGGSSGGGDRSEVEVGVSDFLGRPTSWHTPQYTVRSTLPPQQLLLLLTTIYRISTGYPYSVHNSVPDHYAMTILNWPEQHQLVAVPIRSGSGEKALLCSMESTE